MSDKLPMIDDEASANNAEENKQSEPVEQSTTPVTPVAMSVERLVQTPTRQQQHYYEELMGGSIPCPSCEGSGRIPKERESELVALIPVNDKRLRPRRTVWWVLLGVLVCAIVSGLLLFFLIPRSLDLSKNDGAVQIVQVLEHDRRKKLVISFENSINVSNHNYFQVKMTNAKVVAIDRMWPESSDVMGAGENTSIVPISLLHMDFPLVVNSTLTLVKRPLDYCESAIGRLIPLYLYVQFDFAVTFEYLNHREQDTVSSFRRVCCLPSGNCTGFAVQSPI